MKYLNVAQEAEKCYHEFECANGEVEQWLVYLSAMFCRNVDYSTGVLPTCPTCTVDWCNKAHAVCYVVYMSDIC